MWCGMFGKTGRWAVVQVLCESQPTRIACSSRFHAMYTGCSQPKNTWCGGWAYGTVL
jgi:hypothetical protein